MFNSSLLFLKNFLLSTDLHFLHLEQYPSDLDPSLLNSKYSKYLFSLVFSFSQNLIMKKCTNKKVHKSIRLIPIFKKYKYLNQVKLDGNWGMDDASLVPQILERTEPFKDDFIRAYESFIK